MMLLRLTRLPQILPAMLLVFTALMLSGCFHNDDDPPPVPDANPTGYYDNINGTASVSDGNDGTLTIRDLQGMVNSNRFIAISDVNGLVYDGTITNISGNDFTAMVTVFQHGSLVTTATVTGMITAGSKITGTLTGSGLGGSGTFELIYALSNNTAAALSLVQNDVDEGWFDRVGGGGAIGLSFAVDATGNIIHALGSSDGVFDQCAVGDTSVISPVTGTSLYTLNLTLSNCFNESVDGAYNGLASMRDESIEFPAGDRLVLVVSNSDFSLQGEFKIAAI